METYELLLITFSGEKIASSVLKDLTQEQKEGRLRLFNAATIARNRKGKVHLQEIGDLDTKHGSIFGAVIGGVVGLLGGPIGAVVGAAAGAVTGGLVSGKIDLGFSNQFLHEIEENLKPGSSALVVLVEKQWIDELLPVLELYQGMVLRHVVQEEIAQRLVNSQTQ